MLSEVKPAEQTVKSARCLWRVSLVSRTEMRRSGKSSGDAFYYRPAMSLSSRRTGMQELAILMGSMRDGSLRHACGKLAEAFVAGRATYKKCEAFLRRVALWSCGPVVYNRIRALRRLFQAQRVDLALGPEDSELRAAMRGSRERRWWFDIRRGARGVQPHKKGVIGCLWRRRLPSGRSGVFLRKTSATYLRKFCVLFYGLTLVASKVKTLCVCVKTSMYANFVF